MARSPRRVLHPCASDLEHAARAARRRRAGRGSRRADQQSRADARPSFGQRSGARRDVGRRRSRRRRLRPADRGTARARPRHGGVGGVRGLRRLRRLSWSADGARRRPPRRGQLPAPCRAGHRAAPSADGAPFNTWGLLGSLELRDVVPPMAAGSCGSTRVTPASGRTDVVHLDVAPVELVSVRSAAPEVTVRLVNPESADESVQALGGPVLVVVEDSKVVALSRTTEPLPVGELEPGDAFTFTGFEALVHCETGESLPSGRYEVHVGRILVDPEDSARRHFDLATRASVLVVTERTDVQPTVMARPTMPVCGDVVTEPELDLDALPASIDHVDVIENQGEVFGGGGGPGVDNGMIELELALDEPIETFGGTSRIRDLALLRDGVVVGVQ